jgi:hypothetical protein
MLDRILDHHERETPDGRDSDQRRLGEAPQAAAAARVRAGRRPGVTIARRNWPVYD